MCTRQAREQLKTPSTHTRKHAGTPIMLTREQISKQASQVRQHENMALAKHSKHAI